MPANVAPGAWDVLIYPLDDTIGNHGSFTAHPEPLMVRYGDAVPNAPTGVTATAGDGTADVHWTAPSSDQPIDSYTVTATPGGRQVTVGGAVTSALFDGLNNGTPYTFSVVATSSIGTSPASVPSNSVTPATVPSAPSNVTAIPGDTSARVSWSAPNNGGAPVTGYFLTVSPGGQTIQVAGSVTTRTVTGLTNGAAYSFTVVAANRVGQSPPSEPSNQVTPAGVPARISKPAAAVSGRSVTLTWVAPGANGSPVTGYVVRWAGKSKRVPAPTTSLILNALKPGKYKFSVAAVNAIGTGPASPARSVKIK
ncbi:fibronectin type III domain-containing protein [Nocardioides sp.]|uniref:fibronectin type III domain-containing protein n=1 Tax=Nocardioides sp. TaxID=35761 RepID=UPI00378506C6